MEEKTGLRHGYTTGANATAATKAALLSLVLQKNVESVGIVLPTKEIVTFSMDSVVFEKNKAIATVIKDGGDDPDATHGAKIVSTVRWNESGNITLDGGVGVGRVTKPGLPVPVGQAAINPVPRKMILSVANEVKEQFSLMQGFDIVISVPDGEEIAKKTLNFRLGIVGGISILGTRGTVVPFSTAAFKASIAQAIDVAIANGCHHLFLTTGGRSEKYAMEFYPNEPEEAFIEMGDFVGFAVKQCAIKGIGKITLVGMMGKFSKVAQGIMMVHSKSAPVDFHFLAKVAEEAGVPSHLITDMKEANTASQVGDLMIEHGYDCFFTRLCEYICRNVRKEVKCDIEIEMILVTLKGQLLGRTVLRGND